MSSFKQPARFALLAAVAALFLASAPAANAARGGKGGKPSGGGTGTISLVLVNSSDGLAHWGQKVTFNVSTTATSQPWVNLKCYQNGTQVSEGWEGFFAGSLDDGIFGLYSSSWTSGAGDCTAYLTNPQWTVLGSTSFHVEP